MNWVRCRDLGHCYSPWSLSNSLTIRSDISVQGYLFIDRNPRYFEVLLDFLRTGRISLPADINYGDLRFEAEYFCIEIPPHPFVLPTSDRPPLDQSLGAVVEATFLFAEDYAHMLLSAHIGTIAQCLIDCAKAGKVYAIFDLDVRLDHPKTNSRGHHLLYQGSQERSAYSSQRLCLLLKEFYQLRAAPVGGSANDWPISIIASEKFLANKATWLEVNRL